MTTLDTLILEETYRDSLPYISAIINRLESRSPATWDEMQSDANLVFMLTYKDFMDGKVPVPFLARLQQLLKWRLVGAIQEILRVRRTHKEVSIPNEDIRQKTSDFVLQEFIETLSEDARIVVALSLEATSEIDHALSLRRNAQVSRKKTRGLLRRILTQLGWDNQRIMDTFNEIGRALQ
jgi:hypothetical protein